MPGSDLAWDSWSGNLCTSHIVFIWLQQYTPSPTPPPSKKKTYEKSNPKTTEMKNSLIKIWRMKNIVGIYEDFCHLGGKKW